jgi:Ca2+-binding RTX toxin-like protein
MRTSDIRRSLVVLLGAGLALASASAPARAEHCWEYAEQTTPPYSADCRQRGAPTQSCDWVGGGQMCASTIDPATGFRVLDPNLGDCCGQLIDPAQPPNKKAKNLLDFHADWHACFGNSADLIEADAADHHDQSKWIIPVPGRGAAFAAFHRQFEWDFNLFRERETPCKPVTGGPSHCFIESMDWGRNMKFPFAHEGAGRICARVCRGKTAGLNVICTKDSDCATGVTCPLPDTGQTCLRQRIQHCTTNAECAATNAGDTCVSGLCTLLTNTMCTSDIECVGIEKPDQRDFYECGHGQNRPPNIPCVKCTALPQCLFLPGAGPINAGPQTVCGGHMAEMVFPNVKKLTDFESIDQIGAVMDDLHHGGLHQSVAMPLTFNCLTDNDCKAAILPGNKPLPGTPTCSEDFNFCQYCETDAQCATFPGLPPNLLPSEKPRCNKTTSVCEYTNDASPPGCSPRDPMFWRLHKNIDDGVRAWQKTLDVDVSVVLDRSGSMLDVDGRGQTKLSVANEAMALFANLLRRETGHTHRIGVVSYSTDVKNDLPMTRADTLTTGQIDGLKATITSQAGGCTSIGGGLEAGVGQLCKTQMLGGKLACPSNRPDLVPSGQMADANANKRRAIILLTDGLENRKPCLSDIGVETPMCGGQCGGGKFEQDLLGAHTQLCAVGFGREQAVNGALLTLLAEKQGGIYMRSPDKGVDDDGNGSNDRWLDLKDFFVKCLGKVTKDEVAVDPKGKLAFDDLATPVTSYSSCGDSKITFVSGWDLPQNIGDLVMLVTTPSGELVRRSDAGVEAQDERSWSFVGTGLPYKGQQTGTWQGRIVRRHSGYVNPFTTDALAPAVGTAMVRDELHRLCPDGCAGVLYFEDGKKGASSSYQTAVAAEEAAGLLTNVTRVTTGAALKTALESGSVFSLIVYAHQLSDVAEPYDDLLQARLCAPGPTQPVIFTDTRASAKVQAMHACLGALPTSNNNWLVATNAPSSPAPGALGLTDPGYAVAGLRFSYGIAADPSRSVQKQATTVVSEGADAAILARAAPGYENDQNWFIDVLFQGLSGLEDAPLTVSAATGGDGLTASVRVLPGAIPLGGWDSANVTVEVESPTVGIGKILCPPGGTCATPPAPPAPGVDGVDGRAAVIEAAARIPTQTQTFALNDNGLNGDLLASNGQFSTVIPSLGKVDGLYKLHFVANFTKNGCTTRRELVRNTFVDVGVDPAASGTTVTPKPGGGYTVSMCPKDQFGNPSAWGRRVTCGPSPECTCTANDVVDHGNGCYTINVTTTGDKCEITGLGGGPMTVQVTPVITAPPQTFTRCFPAAAEETLVASTSRGTLSAKLIAVNSTTLATPLVISMSTKKVKLPVGHSIVEWTATDTNGKTSKLQQGLDVMDSDAQTCCVSGQTKITGTDAQDSLTPQNEVPYCVMAKDAGDYVVTKGKADLLFGGEGADFLGAGNGTTDVVVGGLGSDNISGGGNAGKLKAHGGADQDTLYCGQSSSCELYGGGGGDMLTGSAGADTLVPGSGAANVSGGAGNDTVTLYNACEAVAGMYLDGGSGSDTLVTPLSKTALQARGVTVVGFETITIKTDQAHLSDCFGRTP